MIAQRPSARARVQCFETDLNTVGPLIQIIGRKAEVKYSFAAGAQPFHGVALPCSRFDHLQVQVSPAREGIAIGNLTRPVTVSGAVIRVDSLVRTQADRKQKPP